MLPVKDHARINKLCTCLVAIFFSIPALAESTAININGNIIASPCNVDTDTVNKTVELGEGRVREMSVAGAGGEWADFELLLTNCPAATVGATVTFSGTPDDDDATAFKNSADATGIALRLASRDRATTYQNDSTMTQTIDTATHSATFPLSARMFSPKGNPTSGQFAAAVNVSFTYQ